MEINVEVEKGGDDITANNCLYVKIFVPEGEENKIPEGSMKVALNQLLPDISLDTIPIDGVLKNISIDAEDNWCSVKRGVLGEGNILSVSGVKFSVDTIDSDAFKPGIYFNNVPVVS